MRKWLAIFFWLSGLVVMIVLSFFAWLFRDGWKIGMEESHGLLAWQRFADGFPITLLCTAPFLVVGCLLFPWKRAKSQKKTEPEGDADAADAEDTWPPAPRLPDD